MAAKISDRYLTTRELARLLRCTDQRVKALVHEGRVPGAIDIGTAAKSVLRIPLSSLDKINAVTTHKISDNNRFGL